ncbi:heavy metal translocating P-type ATPase [Phormidium sp. CCY1219]|uniref:heavy metal translocating P-type ATPase n=1 Tax=Phormidium sp. CCY1219 TaxID=2886104 RepID=UPI002D1E86DF|nr:heavy metal translocating P-type ATPase [Phormidium sp. CCY1219]MEB3831814.1 heavy metal translocating P-type ATPase [Phormidium sp. CCY1219]
MNQKLLYRNSLALLYQKYPEAAAALACGILLCGGWLALHFGGVGVALLLLSAGYCIGGYQSAKEGLATLWEEKELDVDLLMIVAALGAAALGLWQADYFLIIDGAVLILIFAISGALEDIAMQRTDRNIRTLMAVTPDTARAIVGGEEREIAIAQLQIGDIVLVKPGELIPTDGEIVEGKGSVNQAPITGESLPVDKTIGDRVFAGTLNGNGVLRVSVDRAPESSLIQRVIRLVEQAQTDAPPSQEFIEAFERTYAKVIVAVGLLLAWVPPIWFGWSWETTIYRALIFLVVASPCALMASIMPALLSGIANGARQGILFKNGAQLEKIGTVKAVAFDKTGTLTTGDIQVKRIIPASGYSESEVLRLAAALESCSEHPIGEAIASTAKAQSLSWEAATQVQAQTGHGISGEVGDEKIWVGKSSFLRDIVPELPQELCQKSACLESVGQTVVWVAKSGKIIGLISLADTLRPHARPMMKRLKKLGIQQIVMLTGDNQQTANSVARELGIDRFYADLLPEEKLTVIRQLQKQYQTVAMVGDGINDAPALALANIGIAMGGAGSDVALETADIVLMANRLEKLDRAIELGRRANRIIKQNMAFALGFIALLLIANFAGSLNMPLGVMGHEGSTLLVTLSGLRLLKNWD